MKKVVNFIFIIAILLTSNCVFAEEQTTTLDKEIQIQKKVSNIGLKIANANKIDVRMIFVYKFKEDKIKLEPSLTKRQIIIYDNDIQFADSEAEVAALLSREIIKVAESYTGFWKGLLTSAQIKCAPKKYEIFFDKRAVDFMVAAGYNPLAMITFINKAYPQKRFDKVSRSNLTSKRLANIYEYIYTKYPIYLQNNELIKNESYQNFLLTSRENRQKLHEKIKSGSKKAVKYE